MPTCVRCGTELTVPARGRRPRYCSRACQAQAYRARVAARESEPVVPAGRKGELSVDGIVETAIAIADAEGLEAVSMRRVATALGAGTMSLYRYVPGKDELTDLMAEAVLAGVEISAVGGWRARLEVYARGMWAICRRHPWVLQIFSATRPRIAPSALAKTEWVLRGFEGLSHDLPTMVRAAVTVVGYVQGMALFLVNDVEAERRTGVTKDQWWEARRQRFNEVAHDGRFPLLARVVDEEEADVGLDEEFEFGLQRMLDGLAVYLESQP
ncbi:TetR/AcrR family transcriptional regulator [Streptosporangium sp. KLBMP 9127]|nr:TetR/AcrR family transcriptional regulator [Streptosporangium sp. KLBMP 9127]